MRRSIMLFNYEARDLIPILTEVDESKKTKAIKQLEADLIKKFGAKPFKRGKEHR